MQERARPAQTDSELTSRRDLPAASAERAPAFVNAGAMLAVCATAFAAIAFDVNSSTSLHLLQPLDSAVHGAVSSNVPLSVRIWASHELSDLPVSAACVAGWLCLGTILVKAPRTAALTAAAATLLNVAGARTHTIARAQTIEAVHSAITTVDRAFES